MFNPAPAEGTASNVELLLAYKYHGMEGVFNVLVETNAVGQVQKVTEELFYTAMVEQKNNLSASFLKVAEEFRKVTMYHSTPKQKVALYTKVQEVVTSTQLEEFLRLAMFASIQDWTENVVDLFKQMFVLAVKMEPASNVEEFFVEKLLTANVEQNSACG
jgi:hypothetical protein